MSQSDLVCVRTFANRMQAEYAESILKAEDIQSMVTADSGGWLPHLAHASGGVRLLVLQETLDRAAALLQQTLGD